jgi:cold shock CspA family protein
VVSGVMADHEANGRVTRFTREQGFGVVTLEDGREVPFDVSVCPIIPEEGDPVRVRVGTSRLGKPKVVFLEKLE